MKQLGNRNLLRRQLRDAWQATMAGPYLDQAINSERALQAHLAAHLLNAFEEEGLNRQLFVEPKMSIDGGAFWIHPDMLVCNSREAIGIVELKYKPKTGPSYGKDFESLESVNWDAEQIEVVNTRYRGPDRGGKRFAIADRPLFVWAGVYSAPYRTIPEHAPAEGVASNLLVLHAVTHAEAAPDLYAGARRL